MRVSSSKFLNFMSSPHPPPKVGEGASPLPAFRAGGRVGGAYKVTLRRLIIVPGGLITSPWVVLVVLVLVFVVPGVVLVVVDVVASHYVY